MMMTGYTAAVLENDCSFEHFVWVCMHAFVRHDSMDEVVVGAQPPDYYAKTVACDKTRVAELRAMTDAEYEADRERRNADELTRHEAYAKERVEGVRKLRAMLVKVEAWDPPTQMHHNLKGFMGSQLCDTIDYNTGDLPFRADTRTREEALISAEKNLMRSIKNRHDEQRRYAKRNKWVADLRKSVPIPDTMTVVEKEEC